MPSGRRRTSCAAAQRDRVDVFFIHPMTYLARSFGNARYVEPGEPRARLENGVLRFQASVFNLCCRSFAPRCRQASLGAITCERDLLRVDIPWGLFYMNIRANADARVVRFLADGGC